LNNPDGIFKITKSSFMKIRPHGRKLVNAKGQT